MISATAPAVVAVFLAVLASPQPASTPPSASALVDACHDAFEKGDYKAALEECNKAITLDPTSASAYAVRGDVKDVSGDPHGALSDYDEAIKLNPNYQYAYATRCDTRRELEDYPGATADCTQAIKLDPTDGYAFDRFGRLDLDLNYGNAAVDHYTSALKNEPNRASAYAGRCEAYVDLEKYDLALGDCKNALDLVQSNKNGLFYLAIAEHGLGRNADSVGHWSQYITKYPDEATPFYNRGLAHRDANEPQAAIQDFSTYVQRKPRDGDGFYQRGALENNLGNRTAALKDLKEALRLYQIAGDDDHIRTTTDLINRIGDH